MKAKVNFFRTLLVLWVVLLAVAVALFGVGPRTADTQTTPTTYYEVKALGVPPGSTAVEPNSIPYDLNDLGHVVGEASISGSSEGMNAIAHAFLYENGQMKDLGTLGGPSSSALAINDSGHVVGYSQTDPDNWYGPWHAFLWTDEGDPNTRDMKDLGTLPGDTYSRAYGINSSGQVVGMSHDANGATTHAFLYENGQMRDLGTLPGGASSAALSISDSGQVVGWSDTADGESHAFLYENGQMRDLGTLPGGTSSAALAINISGQIVGYGAYGSSSSNHAFLYRGEGPMQDLGVLSSVQNHSSWANDINDRDQVVGYSDSDYNSTHYNRAFLYENEEMIDLGSRLHPDNNSNIWNLDSANGINNEGQIVTEGWRKEANGITYTYSGLLLTPTSDIPPPPDSQAPSPPSITSPQNNSYDEDGSFTVYGTAEGGSTVELFEGTTSKGTIKADSSSGAWSIDLSGVSEGSHTYTAKATDAAGNTSSASNSITVTVDKSAPTVSKVSPAGSATGVAPNTSVTAQFSEDVDGTTLKVDTFMLGKGKLSASQLTSATRIASQTTVSYEPTTQTAALDPYGSTTTRLAKCQWYTAKLTSKVKDKAGNPAIQKVWQFKTLC
jgi:probable HAF family extracellular repeat protein